MLTWNEAFGWINSYDWANGFGSAWLPIAAAFQQALGPHYAGVALTSYKTVADGVTETRFGSYSVVANWNTSAYDSGTYRVEPGGFLARTDDGKLVAGEFPGPSGPVYRIVQNGQVTFTTAVPAPG